ncbi:MAG: glycosyltransferase family 2 protein [Lachnospiraceae bacterium]|nr:glycosyltransferase family 2 protein [Lachnospiraceae bacterium]
MLVSVCIPCYRSAKTLPVVVQNIKEVFETIEDDYQIVLVNDGSPDNTFGVILELCRENEKITGVNLTRNYGQASAKLAALRQAKGDAVVFMDDDGQHPAEGIPALLAKLKEGYDVVYADFKKKKHSLFKRMTSSLHNRIAEFMGNKPKGIKRSSFSVWSRPVVDAMLTYKSPFVSIGSFLMSVTTKYANVEVEHKERLEGKSGYTLKKLFKLWLNIFISFSMMPLRMATYLGFLFSGVGFIGIIYLFIRKLVHPTKVAGYTSTMITVLFMSGVIMLILGVMGEYLGRIYMTVSGMPQFYVREVINGKDDNDKVS